MKKATVLIIEDEAKIRSLLTIYLEKNDYRVLTASNGIEGLEMLQQKHPDIIVLDILMPEMDGFDVCKTIRQSSKYKHIPIIYLSSLHAAETIIEGLDLGADDYVTKPFDPNELIARVTAILRRTKAIGLETTEEITVNHEKLTAQEQHILAYMDRGFTNREIAERMYLTEGTIKVYNHIIFQKLQVKNRTQAIVRAKEVNLI